MNELNLRYYGDEILRTKCTPVKDRGSDRVKAIVERMLVIAKEKDGVGLAAPQVGLGERIIVIDLSDSKGGFVGAMINPVILGNSAESQDSEEGCLSLPGQCATIKRPLFSQVEYYDEQGKRKKISARGFFNTVIHHEIDHLNGVLYIDHIENLEEKAALLASLTLSLV